MRDTFLAPASVHCVTGARQELCAAARGLPVFLAADLADWTNHTLPVLAYRRAERGVRRR